jgi:hypothetical protein
LYALSLEAVPLTVFNHDAPDESVCQSSSMM